MTRLSRQERRALWLALVLVCTALLIVGCHNSSNPGSGIDDTLKWGLSQWDAVKWG